MLKRYVLTIGLGLLIVSVLVTYYGYGVQDKLPRYRLSTMEGAAEEGNAIKLDGAYGGRVQTKYLEVDVTGTKYSQHTTLLGSYLNTKGWLSSDPGKKQLYVDYPQFMRGKGTGEFYQDKEWIIYATASASDRKDPDQALIQLDFKNVTSGDTHHYGVKAPDMKSNADNQIIDVQRVGDEIHVLMIRRLKDEPHVGPFNRQAEEYQDIVVQLNDGQLLRHDKLPFPVPADSASKPDEDQSISNVHSERSTIPSDTAVFLLSKERTTPHAANEAYQNDPSTERIWIYGYNYATGQLKELPDLNQGMNRSSYRYEQGSLFIYHQEEQELTWSRYDVKQEQMEGQFKITAQQMDAEEIITFNLQGDRFFLLLRKDTRKMAAVVNATNGKVLYRGEVSYVGAKQDEADALKQLRLHGIEMNS